ncbi:bacteriohemerythrin [Methylomonas sp. AM2-LC]|uniref:bacteriohemerythrin n=1 Tax=Methylomonas sp. AM2-LC TaxID=3153301 RepID=UPI003263D204
MSLLNWSSAFCVGVTEIDDQHKKLVDMANRLNDAMQIGQGREALAKILNELVDYTVYHFGTEEKLMSVHQYPNQAAHKEEHKKLIAAVSDFKRKFDTGDAAITSEIMNFLRDWLTKHILQSDKLFAKDLNSKGVK